MKKNRKMRLTIVFSVTVFVLTACGKGSDIENPNSYIYNEDLFQSSDDSSQTNKETNQGQTKKANQDIKEEKPNTPNTASDVNSGNDINSRNSANIESKNNVEHKKNSNYTQYSRNEENQKNSENSANTLD